MSFRHELYIQFHGCNVQYIQYVMVCINWQGGMFRVQCIHAVLYACTNNDVQYMYMHIVYVCMYMYMHVHAVLL